MGIDKGEKVQAKVICNIFNRIVAENFPNLKKEMSIQVKKASRPPNGHCQNKSSVWHITVKTIRTEN
jgi:hypothetical protein